MKVDIYPNGPLGSNMYIINTDFGCFLIDPSVDPDKVPIDVRPYKIDAILMTHGHFDHINAVDEWKWIYKDSPIFLAEEDQVMLKDSGKNGSGMFTELRTYTSTAYDVDKLKFDGITVIKTPGHSMGSVCYLFEEGEDKVLFSGDTVFEGSVGRTDLYGGSSRALMNSLKLLKDIPASTDIYPGHGPATTMKEELTFNPFFNF